MLATAGRYAACDAERGRHRRFVAHDRDTAVVGHVEGLVGVGRPRVRALGARRTGAAGAGMPPPTARTRRRRAPRRRAGARRRSPPRSRRTRRSGRRRPEGRRSSGRRAPRPARRSARHIDPALLVGADRDRAHRGPAMRPASTTEVWTAPPARNRIVGAALDAAWRRRGRGRAGRRRARRSGARGSRSSRRSRIRPRCPPGSPRSSSSQRRRDLLDRRRRRGGLARAGVLVPRRRRASRRPARPGTRRR